MNNKDPEDKIKSAQQALKKQADDEPEDADKE